MITNQHEYFSKLHLIQDKNSLQNSIGYLPPIPIPESKPTLKVDLNTRKIEAPEFLGLETDQKAETFFFEVDRFYGHIDLALTTCIIQYITPTGKYIYPVPFYDTVSSNFSSIDLDEDSYKIDKYYTLDLDENKYVLSREPYNKELVYFEEKRTGKMYIPWQINKNATLKAGTVEYNLRFYNVNLDELDYVFNLNTLSAKSKIIPSVNLQMDLENNDIEEITDLDEILVRLKRLEKDYEIEWTELD